MLFRPRLRHLTSPKGCTWIDDIATMISERPYYDHRIHAGNAGDVWKHFIIAEAADFLLSKRQMSTYAESHVGYPGYNLSCSGEWKGGIGRCWPRISWLGVFCYFQIIRDLNTRDLIHYPGSADLVLEVARRHGHDIEVEVWDIDPLVAAAWHGDLRVDLHFEDGFIGVKSILDRSSPGLILVDPPYIDENDVKQASNIMFLAEKAGWTVLLWQMIGEEDALEINSKKYTLRFNEVNLNCGKWQGATMAIAGADDNLIDHLDMQAQRFLDLASATQSF